MYVIGIIGGVASGKSRVAELFAGLGAHVVRADEIGHEVLRDEEVVRALVQRWGAQVLDGNRQIHRSAVASIVFGDRPENNSERQFLESITHPRIVQRLSERIKALAERGDVPAVILDAAVLAEAGWTKLCDRILFVDARRELRLERAKTRGWSVEEFAAREAAQLSLKEKRKLADGVIDNSGSIDHTFAQVQQFWQSLDLSHP